MADRRLLIIVNPQSGKRRGAAVVEEVQPILRAAGLQSAVSVTKYPGHTRRIVREVDLTRYDGICLVGGDGTVHEAVNGLLQQNRSASIPIGIIPGGTGNDVAKHLGIQGPLDGARRIVTGRTSPFDVMQVETNDRMDYCITLVGWAGVADINRSAERLRVLGPPRYAVAAVWKMLFPKRYLARLVLDHQSYEGSFLLVAACNTMFTGSGMRLAPRARTDDGKVDVVIVRNASRWEMLRLFASVFKGSHTDMPCVEYYQARSMSILADDCGPLDLDGEVKGTSPVSIKTIPGAIRLIV